MKGTTPGAAKSGGDKLWEDNWDDDDVEDDFSVLRRLERTTSKDGTDLHSAFFYLFENILIKEVVSSQQSLREPLRRR